MESPVNNRQNRFSILEKKETVETWSQTVLTFPPNLPPEIENILARYCTLNEEKLSEDKDEGEGDEDEEDEEEEREEEFEEEEEDLDSNSRKRLAFDNITDDELECNTPLQVYVSSYIFLFYVYVYFLFLLAFFCTLWLVFLFLSYCRTMVLNKMLHQHL